MFTDTLREIKKYRKSLLSKYKKEKPGDWEAYKNIRYMFTTAVRTIWIYCTETKIKKRYEKAYSTLTWEVERQIVTLTSDLFIQYISIYI